MDNNQKADKIDGITQNLWAAVSQLADMEVQLDADSDLRATLARARGKIITGPQWELIGLAHSLRKEGGIESRR